MKKWITALGTLGTLSCIVIILAACGSAQSDSAPISSPTETQIQRSVLEEPEITAAAESPDESPVSNEFESDAIDARQTNLPEDFPLDVLPLMPNADIYASLNLDAEERAHMISYDTESSLDDAVAFYQDALNGRNPAYNTPEEDEYWRATFQQGGTYYIVTIYDRYPDGCSVELYFGGVPSLDFVG